MENLQKNQKEQLAAVSGLVQTMNEQLKGHQIGLGLLGEKLAKVEALIYSLESYPNTTPVMTKDFAEAMLRGMGEKVHEAVQNINIDDDIASLEYESTDESRCEIVPCIDYSEVRRLKTEIIDSVIEAITDHLSNMTGIPAQDLDVSF